MKWFIPLLLYQELSFSQHILYILNGSTFAAIFQFVVGVGTLAILFLSGEMLGEKSAKKTSPKKTLP